MKKLFFLVVLLCVAGVTVQAQQRKVLFEQFTSSTCGPCAQMNVWLNPLLEANADKVVVIKYQMNWPGNGDPYYTVEGGTRRGFYGVSGVPDPYTNGVYTGSQSAIQNAINTGYAQPAEADITGVFRVVGNMIYVQTMVTPLISVDNCFVHCVVNEKLTTGNKGGNGEKEFHHVMMKMFPDGSGTTLKLTEGESIPLGFSYDMSTTHVEEMDDLEVAVFVQNKSNKTVLNAAYLTENNAMSLPPTDVTASQEGESLNINLSWTAPKYAVDGYNIYRNGVKVNTALVTGTTYKDEAPEYGITYRYGIAPIVGGVEGFWGMLVCRANAIVPTPINVTAKQTQGLEILVEWEMPEGFDLPVKYKVYRGITLLTPEPIAETSFITTGDLGKEYCFQIKPFLNELDGGASDKACVTLIELSVSETDKDALFTLYPNPTDGLLVVSSEYRVESIEIFDMMGRKVQTPSNSPKGGEFPSFGGVRGGLETLNISYLSPGVYIIRITTEKGSAEKRLIKN